MGRKHVNYFVDFLWANENYSFFSPAGKMKPFRLHVFTLCLRQVATISANGEHEIGELIGRAMEKVGKEGVITVAVSMIQSSPNIMGHQSC